MDLNLNGKVAFITGAAQGIGKATAMVLARYGCDLVIGDLKVGTLDGVAKQVEAIGVKVLPIQMNVSKSEDINKAVEQAIEHFGRIDILINCAGISHSSLIVELDESEWDRVMDINGKSVYLCSKAVANSMIKAGIKGKIISVSSQASKLGEYGNGVYSCSKAVVNTLTQVMGQELAQHGINVSAVCPGYINTEIMQKVFRERGPLEGMTAENYEKKLLEKVPMRRMAEPEEIGEFMAFLASDKANYITGVALTIAGGSTTI